MKTTEFLFYPDTLSLENASKHSKEALDERTPESLITKYGHKHMPNRTNAPEKMPTSVPFYKRFFIILTIWMCVLCVCMHVSPSSCEVQKKVFDPLVE